MGRSRVGPENGIDGRRLSASTFGMRRFAVFLLPALTGACVVSRTVPRHDSPLSPPATWTVNSTSPLAEDGGSRSLDDVLRVLSTERVADLKSRGGDCAEVGSILETSVRSGRVSVRPYMWRVGGRLVSGEAQPDGSIVVARHIDPLNVGIRTVDDMVWTLEHEAAHVAFRISNGTDALSDRANELVRACRS